MYYCELFIMQYDVKRLIQENSAKGQSQIYLSIQQ